MTANNKERLEKAKKFLEGVSSAPHGQKNASLYENVCATTIVVYKEHLKKAIKPSHKFLSAGNDYINLDTWNKKGRVYNNLVSTYATEKNITLQQIMELQVACLQGKPSKRFINGLISSTEKYLVQANKKQATK